MLLKGREGCPSPGLSHIAAVYCRVYTWAAALQELSDGGCLGVA